MNNRQLIKRDAKIPPNATPFSTCPRPFVRNYVGTDASTFGSSLFASCFTMGDLLLNGTVRAWAHGHSSSLPSSERHQFKDEDGLVKSARGYFSGEFLKRMHKYNKKYAFVTPHTRFKILKQMEKEVLKGLVDKLASFDDDNVRGRHGKNFGLSNFDYVPVFLYQGDEPDTYHFEPHYPWVIHEDHSDYAEFLRQRRDIRREVMDKNKWTALVVKRLDDLFTMVYARAREHQIDKYIRKKRRVFISFYHERTDTLEQKMRIRGMELS